MTVLAAAEHLLAATGDAVAPCPGHGADRMSERSERLSAVEPRTDAERSEASA